MKIFRFLGKGIGHEDNNKPCQDRLSSLTTKDGRQIYAISDGCSSSAYAEESAQCTIDVINKIFSRLSIKELSFDSLAKLYPDLTEHFSTLNNDDIVSFFKIIFQYEISETAKNMSLTNPKASDFCATLLFAVVEKETTMVGHIGDGNLIFFDDRGGLVHHSTAENGSESTETYFTISPDFSEHFFYDVIPTKSFNSFIMFSDGLQTMFKLEGDGETSQGAYDIVIEPITNNLINTEEELLKKLQNSLANAMHYGFDDWSLIVGVKESFTNIEPVSLKQLFMETFNKPDETEKSHKIISDKEYEIDRLSDDSNKNCEQSETQVEPSPNNNETTTKKETSKTIFIKLKCFFKDLHSNSQKLIFRKKREYPQHRKENCHE